ncbi:MAG TPA: CPBP family glutamic-type intramembrane protease [Verrucomicrobiae bacterium]|jgi:CAAX prenyl protease-like protein|nr:CPBP family glutamic-type intramembrane protease [Verrucomicrobiae bacterium]
MLLLSAPFDPAAAAPRLPVRAFAWTGAAATLAVGTGAAVEALGAGPPGLGRALAMGAVHAGLIGLGWVLATSGAPGWPGPVARLGVAMTLVMVAARLSPWGGIAFGLMPLLLLIEAHRVPALRALGIGGCRPRHAGAGLAAGAFLGAHVLITASLTFGHRVHIGSLAAYAGALGYDAGANVLSAEWLFRGAVFSWGWRRFTFWPAALVSTALAVMRYLLDPALPHVAEARVGAVFYLGLVGLVACALRAWSGSLLPSYLASLAFFAAYRTLAP